MDKQISLFAAESKPKPAYIGNAVFSKDETHRYLLSRLWDETKPVGVFGMINPSKAGAETSDNTVSSCVRWARDWGWGGVLVVNFDSFISTDPRGLLLAPDPTGGAANIAAWQYALAIASEVVLAWGTNVDMDRACAMLRMIKIAGRTPKCLTLTQDGHPHHPRGLKKGLTPIPFPGYDVPRCA